MLKKSKGIISENITFSYDCIIDNPFAMGAYAAFQSELNVVKNAPGVITTKEENDYGKLIYDEFKKEKRFIEEGESLLMIKTILNNLLNARPNNRTNLVYTIHLVEDPEVNAFTAGGHIFINTGTLNYCNTYSELATIIAHEIGHNECGHINLILKRMKIAGNLGQFMYAIKELTTHSFNQFDEVQADCYAADLTYASSYNPLAGVRLWERMSLQEKQSSGIFKKFFMTHPYSAERANCLKGHIQKNYSL